MASRGPGRPRQTSHDDIRAVALQLFDAQGYAATSLAQISAAAGISRTTLFTYFSAKRDLMWDEFDAGGERMRQQLAASMGAHPMDRIVSALLGIARYDPEEHDAFVRRWRIVRESDELQMASAARTAELREEILGVVSAGARHVDEAIIGDVLHALMAVGQRNADDWAHREAPRESLHDAMAARIAPIAEALRPLLD